MNPRIKIKQRLAIFQMYALSKGLFQASTWPVLRDGVFKRLHNCIMLQYRYITGHYFDNPSGNSIISDSDLLYMYEVMSPHTMIRVSRLTFFARIAVKAPVALLQVIRCCADGQKGWLQALLTDLRWASLSEHLGHCASFNFEQWLEYVGSNPRLFKRSVKQFSTSRFANSHESGPSSQKLCPPCSQSSYACTECDKTFVSFQPLSLHMFKLHGSRNIWRLYVGHHVHCCVCLKQFWTRERLLNHVRFRSSTCKHNLRLRGPIIDEAQACELDKSEALLNVQLQRAGRRRHFVDEPVTRLSGPLLPILLPPGKTASSHHQLGRGHNYF